MRNFFLSATTKTFCIIFSLLSTLALANTKKIEINPETLPQLLSPAIDFIVDEQGDKSLEVIKQSNDWQAVKRDYLLGGFTDSAYWVKFTVENTYIEDQHWILEVDYPIIDYIEFYQPTLSGGYKKILAGDKYPFQQRPIDSHNIAFPINSPANTLQTFYLRFETESSMNIGLHMLTKHSFTEEMASELLIFGSIYGIVILATIYSLINAVFLRERMYLFIAISIFGSLGYSLSLNGFAFQYLWSNNLWLQSIAVPFCLNICFGFALFYSREFLNLSSISPKVDKVVISLSSFCLGMAFLSLFLNYALVIRISTVFAIIMSLVAFTAGAISFYHGNKSARYYLIGWIALFIGAVTFALKSLGLIPSSLFATWGQEYGFACIAIFLTLSQSDNFFQAKKKHENQQALSLNAVKTAEKKYRSLFENAMEGIFQVDLSGKLANANKAFAGIVGYDDVSVLLDQPHSAFSLCCLPENEQEKLRSILKRDKYVSGFETNIKLPSNEVRWVSISVQQINNKQGKTMHYEGAMADITETKKREQAEKQQRMAQASTEAKSLFLANMSHEIRTPMNAIIGFTDLAIGQNKNLQLSSYLQKIRMASSNLLGIINDILDFSKIEAGKLEIEYTPFSVKEVLKNLTDIVSVNVESKNLKLHINVDKDIPDQLIGDPLRIGQVLLNLTNNAIKFTSEGSVTVELELLSMNKRDMSINLTGRIIDTGIGISKEKLKTLFSSFTQADDSTTRRFGGTGLGLSISKQLVEMMGGEVFVESETDEGSTFSFTIACQLPDRREQSNPHFTYHQLPLNVLVVDDQKESRELIEKVLISLGHHVSSVTNAHETLTKLKEFQDNGNPFDILMADWLMPEIDGIRCCQMIKDNPDITNPRMVIITGYDQNDAKEKVKKAGIDAYMLKPLKATELSKVIETIFTERREKQAVTESASTFNYKNLNVLLVEDVKMNQELASEILGKKEINVSLANHGKEGVIAVQENNFDIVLMDMQMPVMDGCQATEEIRKFNKGLPIVAMTANAMTGDKNRCLEAGMNDYITKPINPEEMFKAIAKWVSYSKNVVDHKMPNEKVVPRQKTEPSQTISKAPHTAIEAPKVTADTLDVIPLESTTELPDNVEGINLSEGLERCQHNTQLYLKFIADFKRDYASASKQFSALSDKSDLQGIHEFAHKIKGITSNLAATPLANITERIETLDQTSVHELPVLLEEFDTKLAACLASITTIIAQSTYDDKITDSKNLYEKSELSEKVTLLSHSIKSQALDAQDIALEYFSSWPIEAHQPIFKAIIDALDLFDFNKADNLLKEVSEAIEQQ